MPFADTFENPLSMNPPLCQFSKGNHIVGLPSKYANDGKAVPTNRFYTNLLLGTRNLPVWTHPYCFNYTNETDKMGMAISYPNSKDFIINRNNIKVQETPKSFIASAVDFETPDDMYLSVLDLKLMSIQVQLKKTASQFIWIPMVQGMGFVTLLYYNLTPKLQSEIGYKSLKKLPTPRSNIQKYEVILEDDQVWSLYVSTPSKDIMELSLDDNNVIIGDRTAKGTMFQLIPDCSSQIDAAAGCYPIDCELSSEFDPDNSHHIGHLYFKYKLLGKSNSLSTLIYILPHHLMTISDKNLKKKLTTTLNSSVYGQMVGLITDSLEFRITLPRELRFLFINDSDQFHSTYVLQALQNAASLESEDEISYDENIEGLGETLSKYSWILYCYHFILEDYDLVMKLLPKLKNLMDKFISDTLTNNKLHYDTTFGGLVSTVNYSENYYYCDHNYDYSYYIIAAAIIGKIDSEVTNDNWLNRNKDWVQDLIRDYSNPSDKDPYFPAYRSFDWYHGHSWSTGLVESKYGREYHSCGKDLNSMYAIKLWGIVTENQNLINMADLQMGLLKNSMDCYVLLEDENQIIPTIFKSNGISQKLSDSSISYKPNRTDQQSIVSTHLKHITPITPATTFLRSPTFTKQEWDNILSNTIENNCNIKESQRNELILSRAIHDPIPSFNHFANNSFASLQFHQTQSWTWSIAFAASLL
ncbi:hypothetical protein Kpol_1036p89 [Vanderwaltozyma polyspora DSM 70294]|uniref:glucan endo-1,3-beta-D-glucosidase n=1 Tax=Vanderwaltozyma polyspora (strain ATCC 22028 / DSM 70294 / BCRC 21397 / CBS 2163 / NBRC 10782 / NRRL Y-8283 / UCD 57-17) TaxID=436907 RepID=A7TEN5_VANPO|nr:uncharacterized protein Kpol_1036p89 [Vanderwaltozyma polyspora DSM 70294]EDO19342.1 hypothetical protein Kpol_1036p89 [Vanderwaltozyma polyspora DSM 70294]